MRSSPAAGADPAAAKAASYDPILGPKADPARRPDPATEFGLSSPDALSRVAGGVYGLSGKPVGKATSTAAQIDIAAEQIMDIVAKELPAGLPRPKIKVGHDPDPEYLGSYSRKTNTIWINADAKAVVGRTTEAAFEPIGDGYKRLLGLIYHEARHAEQAWLATRVAAGRLIAAEAALVRPRRHSIAEEVVRIHDVDVRVAAAAVKHQISSSDTSLEARVGRDMFEETLGSGTRRAEHDFAQMTMGQQHKLQRRLERLNQEIVDLKAKVGQNESEELRQLLEQADDTTHRLERSHEIYFKLAEEIDARRAGFRVESAFDLIVEAQLNLNMAKIRVQAAERRLKAVPVENEDAIYQQMRRLFIAAMQEHDKLERLGALLPTPAGSTK